MKNKLVKILTVIICMLSLVSALVIAPSAGTVESDSAAWSHVYSLDVPSVFVDAFYEAYDTTYTFLPQVVYGGTGYLSAPDMTLKDVKMFIPVRAESNVYADVVKIDSLVTTMKFMYDNPDLYGIDDTDEASLWSRYYQGSGLAYYSPNVVSSEDGYGGNPTFIMVCDMYLDVCWSYVPGLEEIAGGEGALVLDLYIRFINANSEYASYDCPYESVDIMFSYLVTNSKVQCVQVTYQAYYSDSDYFDIPLFLDENFDGVPEICMGGEYQTGMSTNSYFMFGMPETSYYYSECSSMMQFICKDVMGCMLSYPTESERFYVFPRTYSDAYSDGYSSGYDFGVTNGWKGGWKAGYLDGYTKGEDDGYTLGRQTGEEYGYNIGYSDGETSGYSTGLDEGYTNGYNEGVLVSYDVGYDDGKAEGVQIGRTDALNTKDTFKDIVFSIFDAPVNLINGILDFDLLGINLASLVKTLITLAITALLVFFILKLVKG